jgi:Cu(I)-responsive transcriptional regulator
MKIKDAAAESGLSEKTIRYYEDIGLLVPARSENGYRVFSERDMHMLKFLARARLLGFSIEDCRQLLGLYRDEKRASRDVKQIALEHLQLIETKIAALDDMRQTLTTLVECCKGNERPDCPILNDLAGKKPL